MFLKISDKFWLKYILYFKIYTKAGQGLTNPETTTRQSQEPREQVQFEQEKNPRATRAYE